MVTTINDGHRVIDHAAYSSAYMIHEFYDFMMVGESMSPMSAHEV